MSISKYRFADPMLTGIAVARRTGDQIITPAAFVPDAGFEALFDGQTFGDWRMSTIQNQPGRDNPGNFLIRRGAFEAHAGTDLGMLWLNRPSPARYVLRLEWLMTALDDNSGVFVAFPNPEQQNYDNTAYVGINFGFEIQIDELARPDNALIHRTGAIYSFKGPTDGPLNVHPVANGIPLKSPSNHPISQWLSTGRSLINSILLETRHHHSADCPRRRSSRASSACKLIPDRCCSAAFNGRRCKPWR